MVLHKIKQSTQCSFITLKKLKATEACKIIDVMYTKHQSLCLVPNVSQMVVPAIVILLKTIVSSEIARRIQKK